MKWTGPGYVALAACAAALAPGLAHAQASPFVGTWRLDSRHSTVMPGETAPGSLVTEISRADAAHVRWTTTTTDAQGQKDVEMYDVPGNGDTYSLNGYTTVSVRLGGTAIQSTFRDDASGGTDVLACNLSPDGRQMTCNGTMTEGGKAPATYTDVFDRS